MALYVAFWVPAAAQSPAAGESEILTVEEAIRIALDQSPAIRAARSRLEAARAGLGGARAPLGLQAELAPGVGFTNGNALLALPIDVGGLRPAQVTVAGGERAAAAGALDQAWLRTAAQARVAYFDLGRARAAEAAATEAASLSRQVGDTLRRRVELGEAPAVQATRAGIEEARAEQEVARARGEVRARLAALNLLLGRAPETPATLADPMVLPDAPPPVAELRERALRQRPDLAALRGLVDARRGDVELARARRRPSLSAELAADIWSLDRRDPLQGRDLGLQARLGFPLFDAGRLGAEVARADALARAQEAELAAGQRDVDVEVQRAHAEFSAAREIALGYEQAILPRTAELLTASRSGFERGLTSFVDVLEAQRVVRQTRTEYLSALYESVRAGAALDLALGNVAAGTPFPSTASLKDRTP